MGKSLYNIFFIIALSVDFVLADSDLDQIVITPSKRTNTVFDSLNSTEIITSREIQKYGFDSIDSLLNFSSSISIGSNGGPGQTKSIFLRGSESNHTKILINGVELNPGTLGVPSIQHISVGMIDRIEIAKGSMSTLYGQNTIGGVINIITKKNIEDANSFIVSSGRFNTNKINLYKKYENGNNKLNFNYSEIRSDSYKAKVDSSKDHEYKNRNLSINYQYEIKKNLFELDYYESDGSTEYDSFGNNLIQDHKDKHIKMSLVQKNIDYKSTYYYITKQNKIDQASVLATDYTHTKINQFSIENNYYDLFHTNSILGFSYIDEALYELSYGTSFKISNNINEFFIQSEYIPFKQNIINTGIRLINHSRYGNYFTGNINIGYYINNNLMFTTGLGKSFRSPDGTDLFGYGGNAKLKPEESISAEVGFKYKLEKNNYFSLSIFNNEIRNLIESDGSIMQNLNKARITGIEMVYKNTFNLIDYKIDYTYQEADDLTNDTLLSRRPRNKIVGKFSYGYDVNNILSLTMLGESVRDNSIYDYQRLGGYMIFNANYLHKKNDYIISFKINNIFDKKYRQAHNYNTEGASIYISLATNF
tara:strand:+ start:2458 stop:4230 length:1773 start_codon:yes stop_codon:yes gene_type:complete